MNKNKLFQNLFSIIIPSLLFLSTSCGSFEGVSYYSTDGIYNNEKSFSSKQEKNNRVNDQSSSYYENYFKNFSNETQNENEIVSKSENENNNIYVIDNSPRFSLRYGFNSFDYWNSWGSAGFGFPYNNFSNNGMFWPYYNPYWSFGYQGMYFNNGWGNGYSLYGWNNYSPSNYVVSNRNQYGRKIPYNRGAVSSNSYNRLSRNVNNRFNTSADQTRNGSRSNFGRKIRGIISDYSPQIQSYSRTNRGNSSLSRPSFSRNNYSRGSQNNRSSSSNRSRSSGSSGRSRGSRNN